MKTIEIIKPDDWHVHFRDHEILKNVVPETTRHFSRAIVMPNLTPPILTGQDAIKYKNRIEVGITTLISSKNKTLIILSIEGIN